MYKETRKWTWFQCQRAGATGQFLVTHNCDSLLFSAGPGEAPAACGPCFWPRGWQSANSPRELVDLAVPGVRTTTDAPHLDVAGQSYIRSGTSKFARKFTKVIEKAQKEGKTVHYASYTVFSNRHLSSEHDGRSKSTTNLESQCPPFWFVYLDREDLFETAGKKCVRTPIDRIVNGTSLKRFLLLDKWTGESTWDGNTFQCISAKTLFLSVYVDDIKMGDK